MKENDNTPNTTTITEEPVTGTCDRCPASAALRVQLTIGGELMFCGHHFAKHKDALEPITNRIIFKR